MASFLKSYGRHLLVLSVPLALMTVSGYLLYRDFAASEGTDSSTETAMAAVQTSQGDVKRKPSNRMSWRALGPESPVFRKDSVRTTAGSRATLKFPDGTVIEIGENSMIVLEKTKDRMAIEFVSGNLTTRGGGKAGTGLVLRSQGMEINAADAKVELSGSAGNTSVNVKDGKVTVASASGSTVEINQNQKADLSGGTVGEVQTLPVQLESPAENALQFSAEGRSLVDFSWKTEKNLPGSLLEVATDREFRTIVKSISAAGRTSVARVGLADGSYYWRIRDPKRALSDVHALEVAARAPIRLLDPPENEQVRYGRTTPRLTFSWIAPSYFDDCRIEIASDPEFKTILATLKAGQENRVSTELQHKGAVHWRLVANSSRGVKAETSPSRQLELRKLDRIEAPTLLSPKGGAPVALASDGSAKVDFRWGALEDATGYRVEVSRTEGFKKPETSLEATRSEASWKTSRPGRWFWRVSANAPDGLPPVTSTPLAFTVVSGTPLSLLDPPERQNFEYTSVFPAIDLRWEKDKDASRFEIELARDVNFATGLTRLESGDPRVALGKLDDGIWFWRVRALDSDGTPVRASATRSFELKRLDLALQPELQTPENTVVIVDETEARAKNALHWKLPARTPASDAQAPSAYEVTFKPVDGKSAPQTIETRDSGLAPKQLPRGTFEWSVRAVLGNGKRGPASEARRVQVKAAAPIPKPVIYPILME